MSDNSTEDGNTADQQSFLEQLVGEGKRYADVEELAKAKLNADQFIDQLKKETGELREDLEKRMTLEDILKQKESSTDAPVEKEEPAQSADADVGKTTEVEQKNDENDLGAKIRAVMDEVTTERTAEANLTAVADRLVSEFGDPDKARTQVASRARELGINTEFLMNAAAKSPRAFYEIMGLQSQSPKSAGGGVKGDVKSVDTNPGSRKQSAQPETYSEFQELRRSKPTEYFSPKVQNRLMELYAEKGEAFLNS